MRYIIIIITFMILIGCSYFEPDECTHCWLYAGMVLTEGDIDRGFARADTLVAESPPYNDIAYAIMRNEIAGLIHIENPTADDYDICETMTCAVYIPEDRGHYMVYDFASNLFYDNCHCWHGCEYPTGKILDIFATYH